MKIKKGDTVKILIGKDKGRTGQVIRCLPRQAKVVVKGLNLIKKHQKTTQNQSGGIIQKEAPLHVSKVILVCPHCQKTTRVAYQINSSGKHRFCKKCQSIITSQTK